MPRTPWGQSDGPVEYLPNGIYFASTPSHGGYFVPKKLLSRIPPEHQAYAVKWSGSPQWYEEDVAYNIIYISFPEYFTAEQIAAAKVTIARWITPCAVCGEPQVDHTGPSSELPSRTACATFKATA